MLLSCLQSKQNYPIAAYQFWERYFKRGIDEAGWEWSEVPDVDWAEALSLAEGDAEAISSWQQRTWPRVLEHARREQSIRPFDLFLGYLYPRHVVPEAIAQLQQMGIACINFFCDNVREFRRVPDEYRCFDLHWVPEYSALSMYKEADLAFVHAPMPVWVAPERRHSQHDERYAPTFIGGRDVLREALFAQALRGGARLRLRGPGWQDRPAPSTNSRGAPSLLQRIANQNRDVRRFGVRGMLWKMSYRMHSPSPEDLFQGHVDPAVFGEAYADVTQQALVTIGVNRYPSYYHSFAKPGTYSRLRDIEAPMMGACYLTEWAEGLDQMYELGAEIETFRTPSELVDKLNILAGDAGRRSNMRQRAQARALGEHSVPRTLERLAARIGVSA